MIYVISYLATNRFKMSTQATGLESASEQVEIYMKLHPCEVQQLGCRVDWLKFTCCTSICQPMRQSFAAHEAGA